MCDIQEQDMGKDVTEKFTENDYNKIRNEAASVYENKKDGMEKELYTKLETLINQGVDNKFKQYETQLQKASEILEKKNEQINSLTQQNTAYKSTIDKQEGAIDYQKETIQELTSNIENLKETIENNQENYANELKTKEEIIQQMGGDYQTLLNKKNEVDEKFAQKEEEYNKLKESSNDYKTQSKQTINGLEEKLGSIDEVHKAELEEYKTQITDYENTTKNLQDEIIALKGKIKEQEGTIKKFIPQNDFVIDGEFLKPPVIPEILRSEEKDKDYPEIKIPRETPELQDVKKERIEELVDYIFQAYEQTEFVIQDVGKKYSKLGNEIKGSISAWCGRMFTRYTPPKNKKIFGNVEVFNKKTNPNTMHDAERELGRSIMFAIGKHYQLKKFIELEQAVKK